MTTSGTIRPQPSLTTGESVKQVPYHPDLTTGYAGITPLHNGYFFGS
ncbi:TPA: hypothetical protein PRV34_003181 [Escherichia coli]|nr:hypothetical protein [Escherichia coli]HDK1117386.1 hypothetical protein [Escherichia coli]